MLGYAIKMLIGNKSSFLGVIFGIFLATLLISQQSAIFLGLVARSYRMVTDIHAPNIWVMDPATESEDKIRSMPHNYLDVVRSVPNIEWAVPISVASLPVVTNGGIFDICKLYGIDDATLIGAPQVMIEGDVRDLRREGGVIVDVYSATGILAKTLPDGSKLPLKIGDELEINEKRAIIVGICKITPGFYPQPIFFTAYQDFLNFSAMSPNQLSFIAAKSSTKANINEILKEINAHPGLQGLTSDQFKWRIVESFLKTGILINFGLSVALGIIIGFSIAGQIFYNMTVENLMYFALIKAVGGTQKMILQMIALQALIVGVLGFLLGIGATFLWGVATAGTTLAFLLPWQLLFLTGLIILGICASAAVLSIRKVFRVDPKMLMGT
ncbi:MAG: ABC transporter permease [Parachlamydiaceae bacterium]